MKLITVPSAFYQGLLICNHEEEGASNSVYINNAAGQKVLIPAASYHQTKSEAATSQDSDGCTPGKHLEPPNLINADCPIGQETGKMAAGLFGISNSIDEALIASNKLEASGTQISGQNDPENRVDNKRQIGPLDIETLEILKKRMGPTESIPTKFAFLSIIEPTQYISKEIQPTIRQTLKKRARQKTQPSSVPQKPSSEHPTNPKEAQIGRAHV